MIQLFLPAQEKCLVIDGGLLQTALQNFPFMTMKLVFSPLHTPSWIEEGDSAQFSAESHNKMMINIALHQHPIKYVFDIDGMKTAKYMFRFF